MKIYWPGIISSTDRPGNQFTSNATEWASHRPLYILYLIITARTGWATFAPAPTHLLWAHRAHDSRTPTSGCLDNTSRPSPGSGSRPPQWRSTATGHHARPSSRHYAPGGYGGWNINRERILVGGLQLNETKGRKPSRRRRRPIRGSRTQKASPRRGSQLRRLSRTLPGRRSIGQG